MLFENKELYLLFSTVIPFISFSNRTILAGTSRTILKGKKSLSSTNFLIAIVSKFLNLNQSNLFHN